MIKLLRRKQEKKTPETEKRGMFKRLSKGLSRTRHSFTEGVTTLVLGKKVIDAELLEALENQLLMADVGVDATEQIMNDLTQRVSRKELHDPEGLLQALQDELTLILKPCQQALTTPETIKPYVILMIGVNGSGKTN